MIDIKTKFVSVVAFNVDPQDFEALSRELAIFVQRKGPLIGGFIECIVLANELKTRLLAVGQWESRHAWSAAQWDEDVGRTITDLVKGATSFEIHSYEPIAIMRMR